MDIPLGCFSRPWAAFEFDETLAGIAAAGFDHFGFLGLSHDQPSLDDDGSAIPEAESAVLAALERHGLAPAILVSTVLLDAPREAGLARLHGLVDQAIRFNVSVILEQGHGRPENYDRYFDLMRAAAPYAAEHGITIAVKPHGGLTTTGADCLAAVQRVNHPGYRLCYDPGNLLYYAGEDPVQALRSFAPYVAAMCIKDEVGGQGGSVTVSPGDGDVDFPTIFRILNDHGYAGPSIVETLGAGGSRASGDAGEGQDTLETVNQEAVRAHNYLRSLLGSI